MSAAIDAVLWDFGGVFTTSPFEAFARFEERQGLPENFIRKVNQTNSDHNAWAQFERAAIGLEKFDRLFAEESAALGHKVPGREVIALLRGELRPEMVAALKQCKAHGLKTGCITNNVPTSRQENMEQDATHANLTSTASWEEIMGLFDYVVESSKVGMRKPDPRIYLKACDVLEIDPTRAVYLDDLGINLKPARALGMHTIKVLSAEQALEELEAVLAIRLR